MMQQVPFWKYESCGNDFIFIEDHAKTFEKDCPKMQSWIRHLCARRFGVGADGLVVLQKQGEQQFTMLYFNADGRPADFCGNAALCVSKHVGEKELNLTSGTEEYITASLGENWHSVSMPGNAQVSLQEKAPAIEEAIHLITLGVRHGVIFQETMQDLPIKALRNAFDANISVVTDREGSYHVKTFEKGVEDFTWGCASASAAIASICYFLHNDPGPFMFRFKGGCLHVHLRLREHPEQKPTIDSVEVLGLPRLVYRGFGKHYENWDTERSQESRIPSGAYA
ncbi:MAG: hypothetical protein AAGI90_02655 [Chlamydiota bacterium]